METKEKVNVPIERRSKYLVLPNGSKIVKRYQRGRCYAAVWAAGTTDKQIRSHMLHGEACFFPFNESTNEFVWSRKGERNKPLRIRR